MHKDDIVNLLGWSDMVRGKFNKKMWEYVFLVIISSLWYERNRVKFTSKHPHLTNVESSVKLRVEEWVNAMPLSFHTHCIKY